MLPPSEARVSDIKRSQTRGQLVLEPTRSFTPSFLIARDLEVIHRLVAGYVAGWRFWGHADKVTVDEAMTCRYVGVSRKLLRLALPPLRHAEEARTTARSLSAAITSPTPTHTHIVGKIIICDRTTTLGR